MKLQLIYYKNLLDSAVEKMFASIGSMFSKSSDGRYVFSAGWSALKLAKAFEQCLRDTMLEFIKPSTVSYDKFIVIGSCWPKDNLLLKLRDSSYFPVKLDKMIKDKPGIKYLLKEKDICIDTELINSIFIDTFNKMFNSDYALKLLGEDFSNVIAVSHSYLDCYAVFKVIKWAYGHSNCINVWKEHMQEQTQHLVAINELISKYVPKKTCMNKSKELKAYAKEVKDYLREKIGA